jgi:GT2 family glycosyltransferase
MLISVIIVTWNGEHYIEKLFTSLARATEIYDDVEIIIVDNASKDRTLETIEQFKKLLKSKLRIIRLKRNIGFAGGNNIGAIFAKGDIILLLNQDTFVDPEIFKNIVEVFRADRKIGIVQCLLRQYYLPSMIDSLGDIMSDIGAAIMVGFGEVIRKNTPLELKEIFHARGAALAIKRNVLEKVGGLFPSYYVGAGYEDLDLSMRVRFAGYKIVLAPNCIVYHHSLVRKSDRPENFFVSMACLTRNLFPISVLLRHFIIRLIEVGASLPLRRKEYALGVYYLLEYFKNLRRIIFDRYTIKVNILKSRSINIYFNNLASFNSYMKFRKHYSNVISAFERLSTFTNYTL